LVHLVGHRNRWRVFAEWVYAHITHERGHRLITSITETATTSRAPQRAVA
jgi:hypothetical protein